MEPINVATTTESEFRSMDSCPWGAKCILLTAWGVAVVGVAPQTTPGHASGFVGWAPLPRIPAEIKALLK